MELARLVIRRKDGTKTALQAGAHMTIGRGRASDLLIEDGQVSRRHAIVRRAVDGSYVLSDLGSVNGTFINAQRVLVPERLFDGDEIKIGPVVIAFQHAPSRRSDAQDACNEDATSAGEIDASSPTVVGVSSAMTEVFRLMRKAAQSSIPVLIQGETGTGKELIARAIHSVSARGRAPFIAVNCAALPESLLESQLFGHRRGSFTGADHDRQGLFEAASGGTILLDEIGEMPLAMQPKLLRVLQEGEVTRVGDTAPRRVDVRLVSATNRELQAEVGERSFREDLFYRLSTFPIVLPPLRERRDDIPLLTERFFSLACRRHGKTLSGIHESAHACLMRYEWPGNVRQLQNEIQRAVVLAEEGDWLRTEHLSADVRDATEAEEGERPSAAPQSLNLSLARAEFEAQHIAKVLEQEGGNVSRAATVLGMSRVGLHRKLKDFGLR